jgi:hypothetical protein
MAAIGERIAGKHRLGVLRCAVTGAVVLGLIYILCWAGAALGITNVSHMYIELFTTAPTPSGAALATGLAWSLAFGAVTGALLAVVYNAGGFLDRR